MQVLLNGIISGLGVSVLAVGFSCAYVPTRVFAIELAGVFVWACYVTWACLENGFAPTTSIILGLITATVISGLSESLNHGPLDRKSAKEGVQFISSLGVFIVLVQAAAIIWGNDVQTWRFGPDSTIQLASLIITRSQWIMAGGSLIVLLAFFSCLTLSSFGIRLRALSANRTEFSLRGHNVYASRVGSFALSGFLIGIGAILLGNDTGFDPYMGLQAILIAIVGVMIGGRSSFLGAAVGGLLVGVLRSIFTWYASARWVDPATFALLGLFLLYRPSGLIGSRERMEAEL